MLARMYPTSRRTAVVAVTVILLITVLHPPRWLRSARQAVGHLDESTPIRGREWRDSNQGQLAFAAPPPTLSAPMAANAAAMVATSDRFTSMRKTANVGSGTRDDGLAWVASSGPTTADATAMIVRNGTASVEVSTIDSAVPRVRALATQIGGFVANSSVEGGRDQARSATLEVKAPAAAFERLVTGLNPLGKVESVNISAADVGEEFVDVEARIANDHRLETRLIELLATRTGKLKDVLDVEQELARVREEIERYEGRLRYLRAHTEMSTLSITVHEPVPIIEHVGTNPIVAAARQAWRNFIGLLAFVIASMGVVLPVAAVGATIWWTNSFARSRSQTS